MEIYQSLVLGFIQGLTEFLPISSSGHLVIFQNLFGLEDPEILFDIALHLGSLAAVLFYFRRDVLAIVTSFARSSLLFFKKKASFSASFEDQNSKMALLILAGCLPTALIGLFLNEISEKLFSSLMLAGSMLLLTGAILWLTARIKQGHGQSNFFSFKKALIIGVVQGIAVIPGISRSGSTIAAGLFVGLDRETTARYSFLLSVPAIIGAALLKFKDLPLSGIPPLKIIVPGTLAATVTGYLALKFLVFIVKNGRLHLFAPYCWLCGIMALILGLY